ncbi:VOC family protein [Vibrio gallicus]|uniref:VOC family protein n=1 Tax=Vibrio gallicus TaxID=190897 RepID=UPI0021C43545|nr:VOC family protein [Vibrio gallicus]
MEPRISIITLGVADLQRSYDFYHQGLGLPVSRTPQDGIVFIKTSGTCLALYPLQKLAEDIDPQMQAVPAKFSGITLAHNVKQKHQVTELLERACAAGGKIIKPAQDVFWGGYSGYFSDPDGYMWEVAYADSWEFNQDGSLVID